ncbi:MAG: type I methionyl aminopeptidase [candidate division KSB1 bacterium]|nr:type I methionyl aminopeptidase [candidate division KSB1 bacterium]MDZ7296020.1 type I methionyl aminopeptidase [candidate division KSB1 bacterium]MDZ7384534.1 type I methionyl aminopeptidase [candidate division KSB1 bacterium]MDZ7392831.1 type I methionyl aminopeptidase [candidate division KSB1 bacterium]MDZ7412577.1 type I methionyl aminopeptidase [candidate division KSB1 bacterium]
MALRTQREIELLRACGRLVAEALELAESLIRPGLRTEVLDQEVARFLLGRGARAAFKNYMGFPAHICVSVDEEVVHGIPGARVLSEGEIVGVDIGVEMAGYYADASRTFPVGDISPEKERLLRATREALYAGIARARAGNRLSDISHAIQTTVEQAGFSVVRALVGHGIGRSLHEPPQVPNFGAPHRGPRLRPGMVLAIEPMVNMGSHEVTTLADGWTVVTKDRLPSAHFEHTIVVTDGEPLILTEDLVK